MSYSRIAVTTDFSEESRRAFPAAASLARRFSAELHVVHLAQVPPAIISPWPEVGPYFLPEDIFEDVEKNVAGLASSETAFTGLNPRSRVVRGESMDAIADFIRDEKIGLLVVASHGFSGVKRLLLGSFAEKALRTAPCHVLVVRDGGKELAPRRILVPHDFSAAGKPSLAAAREWASAFQARARLLFVVEHAAGLYDYAANMKGSFKEYLERVRTQALERFRRLVREEWKGVDAEAAASTGDPAAEILREAKDFGADLIVLGTHSRSTLERFFLGSVTQKIVERATCPVLTVRS